MMMFSVGSKSPINLTEGISIVWDENGFLIGCKQRNLRQVEVDSFREGKMRIDLAFKENVIFLVFRIENFIGVSDIAFTARISPNTLEELHEVSDGEGYAFHMFLVEGNTNTIEAMRVVALTTDMSRKLRECMVKQFESEFDVEQYAHTVHKLQSIYTPKQIGQQSIAYTTYK